MRQSFERVRMKDVADAAGVSRVTVSRVLSKKGPVSSEKAKAVLSAIDRLGYQRNHNAGVLSGGRSKSIGVIVEDLEKPAIARSVARLSDALISAGYVLIVLQSHDNIRLLQDLLNVLYQRRVGAILLLDDNQLCSSHKYANENNAPLVFCWSAEESDSSKVKDFLLEHLDDR